LNGRITWILNRKVWNEGSGDLITGIIP
jgi:hypothetical protein